MKNRLLYNSLLIVMLIGYSPTVVLAENNDRQLKEQQAQYEQNPTNLTIAHTYAVLLARANKYEEALQILQGILEEQPENEMVWQDYLVVLVWSGYNESAIYNYEIRYRGQEDKLPAYVNYNIAGAYLKMKELEKARRLYHLAAITGDPRAKIAEAEISLALNDETTANQLYQELVQNSPNNHEIYLSRANKELELENYADARENYEQAIRLLPDNNDQSAERRRIDALLALTYIRSEDYSAAKSILKSYILNGSADKRMESDYIYTLFLIGDYKLAAEEGMRLWANNLETVPSYGLQAWGDAYFRDKQYKQALKIYNAVLKQEPNHRWAGLSKAYIEGLSGSTETYKNLANNPALLSYIVNDAKQFMSIGRFSVGKKLYELVIAKDPGNFQYRYAYANQLLADEMPREAFKQFKHVSQLTNGEIYGLTGQVKSAIIVRDYASAAAALQQLQTKYPDNILTAEAVKRYEQRPMGELATGYSSYKDKDDEKNRLFDAVLEQSIGGKSIVLASIANENIKDDAGSATLRSMALGYGYNDIPFNVRLWQYKYKDQGNMYDYAGNWYFSDFTILSLGISRTPFGTSEMFNTGPNVVNKGKSIGLSRRIGWKDFYSFGYDWNDFSDGNKYHGYTLQYTHNSLTKPKKHIDWFIFGNRGGYDQQSDYYNSPSKRVGYGAGLIQGWQINPRNYWRLTQTLEWGYDAYDTSEPTAFAPHFRLEHHYNFSPRHLLVSGVEWGLNNRTTGTSSTDTGYGSNHVQFDLRYYVNW